MCTEATPPEPAETRKVHGRLTEDSRVGDGGKEHEEERWTSAGDRWESDDGGRESAEKNEGVESGERNGEEEEEDKPTATAYTLVYQVLFVKKPKRVAFGVCLGQQEHNCRVTCRFGLSSITATVAHRYISVSGQ